MPPAAKKRYPGIDLVKIIALLLVVTVHFFLNSGYYQTPMTEPGMHFALYIRWIAYCGVPLFMIATGYLMCRKTLSGKYYAGILRVLILYILLSCVCTAFDGLFFHREFSFSRFIRGFFTFSNARYGWYLEYYFSIFFIIPFLNAAFHAIRPAHQMLLTGTVFLFTIIAPSLYIGFDPQTQFRLFPAFFSSCYPIAYYYMGAMIREHPPQRHLKVKLIELFCFLLWLIFLTESCYQQSLLNRENNWVMVSAHFNDYSAYPVALCSIFLFLLLFDIPTPRWNPSVRGFLRIFSNASFSAYLLSEIFDDLGYSLLFRRASTMQEAFAAAPLLILVIFLCSMLSGAAVQHCYDSCRHRLLGLKGLRREGRKRRRAEGR